MNNFDQKTFQSFSVIMTIFLYLLYPVLAVCETQIDTRNVVILLYQKSRKKLNDEQ